MVQRVVRVTPPALTDIRADLHRHGVDLRVAPGLLHAVDLDADSTVGEVLQAGLLDAAGRLVENDAVVRADEKIDGVHQARVGCRRYRAHLRTFRRVVDEAWADHLSEELGWYARLLSPVRDADVLAQRFERQRGALELEADREHADEILAVLRAERAAALAAALGAMESDRYAQLLGRAVEGAADPLVTKKARRPAAQALPKIVSRPYRKVEKAVAVLGDDPLDTDLHALRVKVKRARYAADAAVPVVGEPAQVLHRSLRALQETLGDHQDAVVAERWLRDHVSSLSGPGALVAGELVVVERDEAGECRAAWPARWEACVEVRPTAWLA